MLATNRNVVNRSRSGGKRPKIGSSKTAEEKKFYKKKQKIFLQKINL